MRSVLLGTSALLVACHRTPPALPSATLSSIDSVAIVTSDIPNFWRAYDLGVARDSAERVRAFAEIYLRPGSPGLRDWMRLRLMDRADVKKAMIAAGWAGGTIDTLAQLPRGTPGRDSLERAAEPFAERSAAEQLVRSLNLFPRYYAAVRSRTLSVATMPELSTQIRHGLSRLKELYPEARFPSVYFLIGTLSTGGTVGRSGLLIGTEQYASTAETPRDELPQWAQVATRANSFDNIAGLVVHEAVHSQQGRYDGKNTLLRQALHEGTADFLSELAIGPWHANTERQKYGRAHEREVWLDFQDEMATDSTIRTWMYNGMVPAPRNHGATDIGYWVGYRIAQSYYERAADKRAAVRELLLLPDAERLLGESGYAAAMDRASR